jgi:uncharacterized protein (DUF58 family)
MAFGMASRLAPVVAFGGAMLLAVAIGRAAALVAMTRLRAAGFELAWASTSRVHRVPRGRTLVLEAELRNRSDDAVRVVGLRPIASTMLDVTVEPREVDIPPRSIVKLAVTVRPRRVGRWGLHGIALEARGAPIGGEGLFEVPLLFSSPMGLEVMPSSLSNFLTSPRGGRSRRTAPVGQTARLRGDGDELRELRDHMAGDPFKRIAWKASAKRGRLLVREMEREERDVVWLVVDASVELWAGQPGRAPLDQVIEHVGALAAGLLRRGDRVGLVVYATRLRSWIPPGSGASHGALIGAALASAASCVDADRCELDEGQVAARVLEHARPLDPRGLSHTVRKDIDALARRAADLRSRAPFAPRVPFAYTPREQTLRHYLAAFGIEVPPRREGEREKAELTLAQILDRFVRDKPSPSLVHIWAPPPSSAHGTGKALGVLARRHVEVRWTVPQLDAGVGSSPERRGLLADAMDDAVRARARAALVRGEKVLRKMRVRIVRRAVAVEGRSSFLPDPGPDTNPGLPPATDPGRDRKRVTERA